MNLQKYLNRPLLANFLYGISSGFPLLLIGSTLQAWMTEKNISLKEIGLVSLVGLPYSFKFLLAPFLDRYPLPFLGKRRGWIIVFQIILAVLFFALSLLNPAEHLSVLMSLAFLVAVCSSAQDILIDAYRRESVEAHSLALASSYAVGGYRIGMLLAGALALTLAEKIAWSQVYQVMSIIMAATVVFTLFAPESKSEIHPRTLKEAVVGPLKDFFSRSGFLLILAFIFFYKVGDSMGSNMFMPFYLGHGFEKSQVAAIAKGFGLFSTILGGIIGGIIMANIHWKKGLIGFGLLQAVSTAVFALLVQFPGNTTALAAVIAFENLSSGLGSAAFVGYMSALTTKKYSATQYALFSSFMAAPRTIAAAPTGWLVEQLGWTNFFISCALVALPGLILIFFLPKLEEL